VAVLREPTVAGIGQLAAVQTARSKKPFCPMTRPLHLPIFACGYRVRFSQTWREEFFEAP
jgi:hypothetical protein